jgi:hypothetical protein
LPCHAAIDAFVTPHGLRLPPLSGRIMHRWHKRHWIHMNQYSRRNFLAATALAAGAAVTRTVEAAQPPPTAKVKLGISTYSYWHFRTAKVPVERVIDHASELAVQGVDILHRQMDIEEKSPLDAAARAYCQKLKRHALNNGVDLICLSIHQNFVSPDAAERQKHIDHTVKCIQIAHELGVPCIRLNSGPMEHNQIL